MGAEYEVIVVGGGHAGCEAASASARRGARTLLLSFDKSAIGAMSCNPAIGGLGKGHLVREVDAMDGIIARAADAAAIHHRLLNASKGAAVQGPRIQADRRLFAAAVNQSLGKQQNLDVAAGEAVDLLLGRSGEVAGVILADGSSISGRAVVLATGTFLGGRMFRGEERIAGGRIGERGAARLGERLRSLGLPIARMKTGTPPRLDGRTIDWAALEHQPSDDGDWTMSGMSPARQLPQIFCAITRTNERTHDVIRGGLDRSPLFSGDIEGRGPRYCPSIEDKIFRFGDRDGHQVFLEPEGLDTHLVYPNGISTSLPTDIQLDMVRSMAGLSAVEMVVPGYAVEYDHVDPRALDHQLALTAIPGVFCAGQINGTTGYEEAAAQGLVAGINAAGWARDIAPWLPDRMTSYIGVLVDDLVLQGVSEPYRMLTARAEYRLHLRADNAEQRLTATGIEIGVVSDERARMHEEAARADRAALVELDARYSASALEKAGIGVRQDGARLSLFEWMRFPEVIANPAAIATLAPTFAQLGARARARLIEDARYAPYVVRQAAEIEDLRRNEATRIPSGFDYALVGGLSLEMREKLCLARPENLAEASRIRGVTPAALAAILVAVRRKAA